MERSGQRRPLTRGVHVVLALVAVGVLVWLLAGDPWFRSGGEYGRQKERALLYLRSIPDSAGVYINNAYAGLTPYPYERFDPGPLRIRMEYPGLAPVETVLIIPPNAPPPQFPLFVFSVRIGFSSVPGGAQPIVNGHPLRTFDAVNFSLPATDTVTVQYELQGERTVSVARLNPLVGLVKPSDTTKWRWQPFGTSGPAELTGLFARRVRFESVPPGAEIWLDSVVIGRTNSSVDVPYGHHRIRLAHPSFIVALDTLTVSEDTPERYSAVLCRNVAVVVFDAVDTTRTVPARMIWGRLAGAGAGLWRDPVQTPGVIPGLDGQTYEVRFECKGYADTTVMLAADVNQLAVRMRPVKAKEKAPEAAGSAVLVATVRFIVRAGRHKPVAGAEVIGIEKRRGNVVRYSPTDSDGVLTAEVPIGDYKWRAARDGFKGKDDSERIKPKKKIREIKLQLKPL